MPFKYQNKYRIESNRWQFWDYSAPGSYFITICITGRDEVLGNIKNKKMELSVFGEIVKSEFQKIPGYHKRAFLDAWVIMPNHVHCIITLGNYDDDCIDVEKIHVKKIHVKKIHEFSLRPPPSPQQPQPFYNNPPTESEIKQYRKQRRKMLIPKLTGKFQMQTSKQINISRNTPGTKNWQHDYHDHVIRNKSAYRRIKQYIINNPKNWDNDKFFNNGRDNS